MGEDDLTPELLAVTYGMTGAAQHVKLASTWHIVRVDAAQTLCGRAIHGGIKVRTTSGQTNCPDCRKTAASPPSPAELAASYGLSGEVRHVTMGSVHLVRPGQGRALCGSVISRLPGKGPGIKFAEDRPQTTEGRVTCRNCQHMLEGQQRRVLSAEYGPDKTILRAHPAPKGSRAQQIERELFGEKS